MDHMSKQRNNSNKHVRREDLDILLDLPQSVLSKILSLLPTKDAVRTSVLSKNWEYKWTSCIYSMSFNDKYFLTRKHSDKENFANFVERVLTHSDTTLKLEKFTLQLTCNYGTRVSTWISAAVKRGVERILLTTSSTCRGTRPVLLPRCFYEHSLKEFTAYSRITFKGFSCEFLKNLKVLKLHGVTIDNPMATVKSDGIARGTLSFPLLQDFVALHCTWKNYSAMNIEAPSLVDFQIGSSMYHVKGFRFFEFRIIAPNLKRFEYSGGLSLENFFLSRPSLVTFATCTNHFIGPQAQLHEHSTRIIRLFPQLPRVKFLHLSVEVIQALAQTQRWHELPTMEMVIQLTLSDCFLPMSGVLLLWFLQKTPNVNTVVLATSGPKWTEEKYDQVPMPSCLQDTLKKVKFKYSGIYKFNQNDYQLMRYLVQNSTSLGEIEIEGTANKTVPTAPMVKTMLLSTTPKASAGALVVRVNDEVMIM